jgi:hypothetical protein
MALLQAALRREEPRDRRRKRDEVWIRWTPRRVGRGVGLQVGGDRSKRGRGQADKPSKGAERWAATHSQKTPPSSSLSPSTAAAGAKAPVAGSTQTSPSGFDPPPSEAAAAAAAPRR